MKEISNSGIRPYIWIALIAAIFFLPQYLVSAPLFILTILTALYFSKRISGDDTAKVFTVFLVSYLLRFALALVLYRLALERGLDGFFYGGDDFAYGDTAVRLADAWREGRFPEFLEIKNTMSFSKTMGFYQYYLTVLMLISKNSTFLPMAVNCSFGALGIPVLYSIIKKVFVREDLPAKNASIIAIGLFAFWPSMMFWSTQNLKEAPTVFFLLMAISMALNLFKARGIDKRFIGSLLCFTGSLYVVLLLRRSIVPIALLAAALTYFYIAVSGRSRNVLKISLFIIAAIVILGWVFNSLALCDKITDKINIERDLRAFGNTVIFPNQYFSNAGDLLSFLPLAVIVAFFYPLPWQGLSAMSLISAPEMILWYIVFIFFIRGLWLSAAAKTRESYFVLFFVILFYLFLGYLESNSGTLFRHRIFILPFSFIFVAAGLQKENVFKG